MEDIEQLLIENIADFLDDRYFVTTEFINGFRDPVPREETELHIRMARAAMVEYRKTVQQ